jgi:uncharacterized protein DUF3854
MSSLQDNTKGVKPSAPVPGVAPSAAPLRLSDGHRQHLHASALNDKTIAAAGVWTEENQHVAGRLASWAKRACTSKLVPCLVLPNFGLDGTISYYYLRPDEPVPFFDRKRRRWKAAKYITPKGLRPQRLYFPPIVSRAAFLDVIMALFLTEGIKKALLLAQTSGLPAVSAQGTWMFHNAVLRRSSNKWELHLDFGPVPLRGRLVFIVYDGADTTFNGGVIRAEARNARLLMDAGADVRLIRIPFKLPSDFFVQRGEYEKVGIDDYLARFQADERGRKLVEIVKSAIPADPMKRAALARIHPHRVSAVAKLLHDLSFHAALNLISKREQYKVKARLEISAAEWNASRRLAHHVLKMRTADSILANREEDNTDSDTDTTHSGRYAPSFSRGVGASRVAASRRRSTPLGVARKPAESRPEDRSDGHVSDGHLTAARRPVEGPLAYRMLHYQLADGSRSVKEIEREADKLRLKWRTVLRAKTAIGIVSYQHGRAWFWRLP